MGGRRPKPPQFPERKPDGSNHRSRSGTPMRDRLLRMCTQGPGCWEWTGQKCNTGYGRLKRGRGDESRVLAHRAAYEVFVGPIPEGACVLHACDNPACINPKHLHLGSFKDNTREAIERGRFAIGERHHNSKLTADRVIEIRQRRAEGQKLETVAALFGVTKSAISAIEKGRVWRHV